MKFRLRISEGPGQGTILPLSRGSRVLLGRGPQSTARLGDDPKVSRLHAVLSTDGVDWMINNRSPAGTEVGGSAIRGERVLQLGERIKVGDTCLVFEEDDDGTGMITTRRVPGSVAAAGAGYDDEGRFHAGYSKMLELPRRERVAGSSGPFWFSIRSFRLVGGVFSLSES